jgi:hypothetical protein
MFANRIGEANGFIGRLDFAGAFADFQTFLKEAE